MTQQQFRIRTRCRPVRHGNSGWDRSWTAMYPDGREVMTPFGRYPIRGHSLEWLAQQIINGGLQTPPSRPVAVPVGDGINAKGVRLC